MNKLNAFRNVCLSVLGLIVVAGLIFLGVSNNIPVELTVAETSLWPLAPGNGTASVAYNLSFAVAVFNPNTAMLVRFAAPLDAELRLGRQPFAHVRLAGAEPERIRPMRSKVYRVAVAAPESVALGSYAAAAAAFRPELIVHGKFKYELRIGGSINTTVRCQLRFRPSTATAFARFERALPQPCTDISIDE